LKLTATPHAIAPSIHRSRRQQEYVATSSGHRIQVTWFSDTTAAIGAQASSAPTSPMSHGFADSRASHQTQAHAATRLSARNRPDATARGSMVSGRSNS
jgi:hypothetical protein